MLDSETKRRIDTARDILVGKVPDPKSQVEQITIALIYKFMDDMDAEAEELGGKRKFFTGDFARYGWAKLMSADIGGHELIGFYAEGISSMPQNDGIPALFRNIFKNAYLPYRDPETLKSFLKVIDEFSYDDSESLGDAFEYLLSVLGSQGDAGQFRTPRHIIDFIVDIIAPKKGEIILDPACGTAGFLISTYKHILRENVDVKNVSTLTPDEKGRLAQNFKGYDISPDMVRLSLVNMYLHGFTDPHIFEYDTLTSEERWNEFADVILANPPFMSPKGGIKPHKRFSIQAKRSEVLFVDYIAEHLTPTGRAGIIVPEGIIFQSQTAYKDLRKMLVENSLVAVISLPAGVFNPYSGVKTSILILDKSLAKQSNFVAFFKIENDGFSLSAQRRANSGGQLSQVKEELTTYMRTLRNKHPIDNIQFSLGLIVSKEDISASGDYNLSSGRYEKTSHIQISDYLFKKLGDICTIKTGKKDVNSGNKKGIYPFFTCAQTHTYCDDYSFDTEAILIAGNGDVGSVQYYSGKFEAYQRTYVLTDWIGVEGKFLYFLLRDRLKESVAKLKLGNTMPYIKLGMLTDFEIPIPPLEIQKKVVTEIENYEKIVNGARAVINHYYPHIPIHPDWPVVELSDVIESKPKNGYSGNPVDQQTHLKVLSLSATTSGKMDLSKFKYLDEDIPLDASCRCRRGDIYLQRGNTKELVGTAAIFDVDDKNYIYPDLMIRVRADETKILSHYLLTILQSAPVREYVTRNAVGAAGSMPKINQAIVERIPLSLPPIATQQAIVAEIKAEQALVAANRELIARFEKKIQATLARIWGEDENLKVEA